MVSLDLKTKHNLADGEGPVISIDLKTNSSFIAESI